MFSGNKKSKIEKLTEGEVLRQIRNARLQRLMALEIDYRFLKGQKTGNVSKRSQSLSKIKSALDKGREYIRIIDTMLDK